MALVDLVEHQSNIFLDLMTSFHIFIVRQSAIYKQNSRSPILNEIGCDLNNRLFYDNIIDGMFTGLFTGLFRIISRKLYNGIKGTIPTRRLLGI